MTLKEKRKSNQACLEAMRWGLAQAKLQLANAVKVAEASTLALTTADANLPLETLSALKAVADKDYASLEAARPQLAVNIAKRLTDLRRQENRKVR